MNITERRERYRAVLAGDQCVLPPVLFDPMSARIAEDLGFELGMVPGSVTSAIVLGAPDLSLLSLSEFALQVRRVCCAANLSVMVDGDHGYGNALNVMRTVEELESAGVSALNIEDTALPIGFGLARKKSQLISLEEGIGKMRAALAARRDPSLVIVARTRALAAGGIPEAIRRIKAYEKAGVDAIFLAWARSIEEVAEVHAETKLPLLVGHHIGELGDMQSLSAAGVRISSAGHLSFQASVKALYDTLKALKDGKSPAELRPTLASRELLAQVTRQSRYNQWVEEFLN
jgi:carboxyvinyl-carboxyphosphonate phosphorylmutase